MLANMAYQAVAFAHANRFCSTGSTVAVYAMQQSSFTHKCVLSLSTVQNLCFQADHHLVMQANVNEIMAASVVFMRQVPVDRPCTSWNNSRDLRHFSVLRKMDNQPFPTGQ